MAFILIFLANNDKDKFMAHWFSYKTYFEYENRWFKYFDKPIEKMLIKINKIRKNPNVFY